MNRDLIVATLVLVGLGCGERASLPDGRADRQAGGAELGVADLGDRGAASEGGQDDARHDAKSCGPPAPVFSRPLFTKLLADLATLSGAARQSAIDAFFAAVAASGGFPVRDAGTVVFLYRTQAATVHVAGSFNGWSTMADPLVKVADSDLFYLEKPLTTRAEYKLVAGGQWLKDPRNPNVVWDGIPVAGLGEFNSVIPPVGSSQPGGRLEWHRIESPQLSHTRDVFVYLPPGYDDESCQRYPVLLVNDGNESLTRAHFDKVAAATFAAGQAKPAILAFVGLASQADRMSEYSCEESSKGPTYTKFLCDTLVPWLDQRFRSTASPDDRGIIGASLGGLISYAALFWRNDCLRRAGGQSGSFWYADQMMVKRVEATSPPVKLLRAYLDNGDKADNQLSTHAMRDALVARGYPTHHWENPTQGHTWDAWESRFDEALIWLYPP